MTRQVKSRLINAGFLIGLLVILHACTNSAGRGKIADPGEKHQAEIKKQGSGMIYADKVDCNSVMQVHDNGETVFHCYLVGFVDSLSAAKAIDKKDLETGKYYQYDMQHDWMAMVHGDSVRPVFYQSRQRLESHRHEGVLVFETNEEPEILIYRDSYGSWGTQELLIRTRSKQ